MEGGSKCIKKFSDPGPSRAWSNMEVLSYKRVCCAVGEQNQ